MKELTTRSGDAGERAHQAAIDYLLGRINYERAPSLAYSQRHLKLDRMRQLLHRLGNPDAGLPIVHIAGTKGKGSTSTFLASVLHAAGLDVGVFSSPHLERLEERFCINGVPCAARDLVALVDRLRPAVMEMDRTAEQSGNEESRPTFFELVTAIALMHFAQQSVDLAILETGLGGRLDSTNVCQPAVSIITSISFDHTKQLGTTLTEIAAEKGGIIKPGVPVVLGKLPPEARETICEMACRRGSRIIEAGVDFQCRYHPPTGTGGDGRGGRLDFQVLPGGALELHGVPLAMLGEHQADNAAAALAAALELRRQNWCISVDAMRSGLSSASLAGRIETLGSRPVVVLDVAHNVAAAHALIKTLLSSFTATRRTLVFAGTRDKDVAGMLRELVPHFRHIIVTQYGEKQRAASVQEVATQCRSLMGESPAREMARSSKLSLRRNPIEAWKLARETTAQDELICVTGSFFIAAELRPVIIADLLAPSIAADRREAMKANSNQ